MLTLVAGGLADSVAGSHAEGAVPAVLEMVDETGPTKDDHDCSGADPEFLTVGQILHY